MKITFLVSGNVHSNFTYRALQLARGLHKQGHEILIIAPNADKYNNFIPEKISSINGIKIFQPFQFKTKRLEINLIPYLFHAAYNLFRNKSDLIYIYKPTPISVIGLIGKFFHKTPVVLDMDDLGSEVMKIEGHPKYQQKLVKWCENIAAKYSNRIVVASTYLLGMYKVRFPEKPIYLMPNGVDESWYLPLDFSKEKRRIVFMGAINRKNILEPLFDVVPSLLKQYPDLSVLIIGDGKYLSYFKEKSKDLGISNIIKFTGWLKIEEACNYLHAGDIGYSYMPDEQTIKAASNMKVPQYMARGVVPIVSNVGDLVASIDYGEAGYIARSNNLSDLQAQLSYALNDENRFTKAQRAHSFSEKNFKWDLLSNNLASWLGINMNSSEKVGKKIYVVATKLPGDFGGSTIRNYNLIKQLTKKNDSTIDVFCITSDNSDKNNNDFELNVRAKIHTVSLKPRSFFTIMRSVLFERVTPTMAESNQSELGNTFRNFCEKTLPDIVHIEQLDAFYCIKPHINWLKKQGVKIIWDTHNVEFQAFEESLKIFSFTQSLVGKWLLPRLKNLEIMAAKKSDIILACSDYNANFFKNYNKNTYVIPNGVDCDYFKPVSKVIKPILIFIGSVEYPPNAEALIFYLKDIHPRVKKLLPDIELLTIGATRGWIQDKGINDESVKGLGFVDDVRPYLNKSYIGICPIQHGSGTRLKILTYMVSGLAIVSTEKGAEGIDYENGKNIIISNESESFATAIYNLFKEKNDYNNIAQEARKLVVSRYDWNVIGERLLQIYSL